MGRLARAMSEESGTRRGGGEAAGVLPKLCGADIELGNFVLGKDDPRGTGAEACRAILRQVEGARQAPRHLGSCNCPACRSSRDRSDGYASWTSDWRGWDSMPAYSGQYTYNYNPQDFGRKFLAANGGCVYEDLNHLELCLPEVLSAHDHVAAWHAMLLIARSAQERANEEMPEGTRIQVLVNNSDGLGNSYGSHTDFLITRACFDNLFHRKLHHQLFLASHLTSSIVVTGAGKVGSENGRPDVPYQIAQRADFYETLSGAQTTYHRPIVNSRDESLCGQEGTREADDSGTRHMARLHVIFFDNTLCHVACLLKIGVTQIILAMLEQEVAAPHLILDDPLEALTAWSHDPDLRAKARLVSGVRYTAVEMQEALCERAARFVEAGRADGLVPRAGEIVRCWAETIGMLGRGDFPALAQRLDWVLKRCALERARSRHRLDWTAPEIKHLDQIYGSLDPSEGLYWAYERSGFVRRVVTAGQIERFVHEPPDDTRAWLRAQVLRAAGAGGIEDVDWDEIRVKDRRSDGSYSYRRVPTPNPLRATRAECESRVRAADTLGELVDGLSEAPSGAKAWEPAAAGGSAVAACASAADLPDGQPVKRRRLLLKQEEGGGDGHGNA